MIVNKRLQDNSGEKECVFTDDPGKTDYPLKKKKHKPSTWPYRVQKNYTEMDYSLKRKSLKPQFLFGK